MIDVARRVVCQAKGTPDNRGRQSTARRKCCANLVEKIKASHRTRIHATVCMWLNIDFCLSNHWTQRSSVLAGVIQPPNSKISDMASSPSDTHVRFTYFEDREHDYESSPLETASGWNGWILPKIPRKCFVLASRRSPDRKCRLSRDCDVANPSTLQNVAAWSWHSRIILLDVGSSPTFVLAIRQFANHKLFDLQAVWLGQTIDEIWLVT